MRTDGVVFGSVTRCGDHLHLEWVCPDCGSVGYTLYENGPLRIVCDETGQEFVVMGIPTASLAVPGSAAMGGLTRTRRRDATSHVPVFRRPGVPAR